MMNTPDAAWWARAVKVRDRLVDQVLDDPDVSMIDIGVNPHDQAGTLAVRVHLRRGDGSRLYLPSAIDGIPICTVHGDYVLQSKEELP